MSADTQKIITVLEMLASSLEEEASIRRVRKWIGEQEEGSGESTLTATAKEPKQVLLDTRRNLLREAKKIENLL